MKSNTSLSLLFTTIIGFANVQAGPLPQNTPTATDCTSLGSTYTNSDGDAYNVFCNFAFDDSSFVGSADGLNYDDCTYLCTNSETCVAVSLLNTVCTLYSSRQRVPLQGSTGLELVDPDKVGIPISTTSSGTSTTSSSIPLPTTVSRVTTSTVTTSRSSATTSSTFTSSTRSRSSITQTLPSTAGPLSVSTIAANGKTFSVRPGFRFDNNQKLGGIPSVVVPNLEVCADVCAVINDCVAVHIDSRRICSLFNGRNGFSDPQYNGAVLATSSTSQSTRLRTSTTRTTTTTTTTTSTPTSMAGKTFYARYSFLYSPSQIITGVDPQIVPNLRACARACANTRTCVAANLLGSVCILFNGDQGIPYPYFSGVQLNDFTLIQTTGATISTTSNLPATTTGIPALLATTSGSTSTSTVITSSITTSAPTSTTTINAVNTTPTTPALIPTTSVTLSTSTSTAVQSATTSSDVDNSELGAGITADLGLTGSTDATDDASPSPS